jgi:hypothetical protein
MAIWYPIRYHSGKNRRGSGRLRLGNNLVGVDSLHGGGGTWRGTLGPDRLGGGSGFGPPGVVFETGVRSGDGLVTITYDPAVNTCGAAPAQAVTAAPRFTG